MSVLLRGVSARLGQVRGLLGRPSRPAAMQLTPIFALHQQQVRGAARHAPAQAFVRPAVRLARPGLASDRLGPMAARWVASAATTEAPAAAETFEYQAEVDRLMDIIVNSLYSNRDVFLRELISNASDALDKVRFLAVTQPEALKGREELEIRIRVDKEAKQIIIEDSGVGMTREQLLANLGTIASSGTKKFMEAIKDAKGDTNLIGQFGVGFYSAFLVADKVTVQTKSWEEEAQWVWEAKSGSHQFTIAQDTANDLVRGTRLTLHLKEDAAELGDTAALSRLIKQYSQFIAFPIKIYAPKKEPVKVVDSEASKKKQEAADAKAKEAGEEAKPVEPVMKTEYEDVMAWRVENEAKPLWMRSPKEVDEAAYNEFFKHTFSEFLDPLAHVHFNVEGTIEFSALLYVPGMAPFEQQNWQAKSKSIKLYVRRVFISDEFDEDLMPRWLSFIKGVVDSSDLPLNVSREILQESRVVRVIRKQLVRRSLEMMESLASGDKAEDYKTFWDSFGRNLKVGLIEDTENRDRIARLLRFYSSQAEEAPTSLEAYVSRMKPNQKSIFYMATDSVDGAKSAPFVEKLVKDGVEVLYLTEAVDEACITNLAKYKDHELVDVSKEGISSELDGDEGKAAAEAAAKEFQPVVECFKRALGERVEKVTVSSRLVDSPCAVVTSKFGWSANMERIMRSQAMGDSRAMDYMKGRKIVEINPQHPVIRGIKALVAERDDDRAADLAEVLYETALITSGFQVDSPKDYAAKVFTLMQLALGLEPPAQEAAPAAAAPGAASSSAPAAASAPASTATPVEAEVVTDGVDPWNK